MPHPAPLLGVALAAATFAPALSAASAAELTAFSLAAEEDLPPAQRSGAALTAPGFAPAGAAWTAASVPCTVVACLMQAGVVRADVFVGDNIAAINATRFDGAWWYWANFALPVVSETGSFASIALHGINYRAHVFLNGALVADNATVVGTYAYFDLDLTAAAVRGGAADSNRLAIRVTRQYDFALGPGADSTVDLGVSFVDWSFADPPDFNLGLWRKVIVSTHGAATLRSPGVLTALPPPAAAAAAAATPAPVVPAAPPAPPLSFPYANLTVIVEARNFDAANDFAGTLTGSVAAAPEAGGAVLCAFSVAVSLAAGAETSLKVSPADAGAACLRVASPALWWPFAMGGAPTLHVLNLSLVPAAGGAASDALSVPFGIRTASSALTRNSDRLFSFNSLPILVLGGGWSPDLFQRVDGARLDRQLALTRDIGVNTIRFEGKMEPDELFESLDALGVLALPGWCCCDAWQHWGHWGSEQRVVAALSMRAQARRLRRFASILGFLISSDELPGADVEQIYLSELGNASWPAFATSVSAASAATSPLTGKTGVKMSGPYSWVPPNYWLQDTGASDKGVGGAWGMLTEGGPGETPMTAESIAATLPANASLWPPAPDNAWGKAGNPLGNFDKLDRFNTPLAARYGPPAGLSDYLAKASAASLEGHKAFMEGYSRRKYANATGCVQWMLNNDAPSNIWHFFHNDLTVGSAGSGAKQALAAPLHLTFDYSSRGVVAINARYAAAPATPLVARVEAFDLADKTLYDRSAPLAAGAVPADGVLELPALQPPPPAAGGGAFFLRLSLADGAGTLVDSNTYWLPEKEDEIDWEHSTWYNTPVKAFADLSALFSSALGPPKAVSVLATFSPVAPADIASAGARWLAGRPGGAGPWTRATVTVANTGAAGGIAFLVRLRLLPAGASGAPGEGSDPAPVFWADNYLVLRSGETRVVEAEFADAVLGGSAPAVAWDFGGGGPQQ